MELLFKKYFWVVNVLFVLGVALLAAKTVNLFVEAAIAPGPAVFDEKSPPSHALPPPPPALLSAEAMSRITGLPLPVTVQAVGGAVDPNAGPVRTSLPLKLQGTLVSGAPQWSVAAILDTTTQHAGSYLIGDKVMEAEILEIERARVIISNGGRKEFIDENAGTGAPPPLSMGVPVREPGTLVTGNGVEALSENNYRISRAEVDKTLSNLNDVAMQARIVPAFKDGQSEGFKLFSIRPDSIYTKIGIQNGDVIKRINGYDMNSPEKALEVYSKLKDATRIEIDLDRNGSAVHKQYNIN